MAGKTENPRMGAHFEPQGFLRMSTSPPASPESAPSGDDHAAFLIARQAIVDAERKVVGHELFDRSPHKQGYTAASDAALLFNAMLHAGEESLLGRKLVFLNCTHDSLAGGHLELIHPDKLVLEIPTLPAGSTPEDIDSRVNILKHLGTRGVRLALSHDALHPAYANWLPLATFIKLDAMVVPEAQMPGLLHFARTHNPQAALVAEKVESAEQFERLKAMGFQLFQGYWFAKPALVKTNTLRPAQAVILQLINLVRQQASTDRIEEVLKKDPTLSFNLLRFINSAGFGLRNEITSFRQAVILLGLKRLFRWAALLMATSKAGDAPPATGSTAVVRGRLMELLAAEVLPPEDGDNAFVTGVFSLLDSMLNLPMAQALQSLALPAEVTEALLEGKGRMAPLLKLTLACESEDEARFAEAAIALQLSNRQVNMAHLQALVWADDLGA